MPLSKDDITGLFHNADVLGATWLVNCGDTGQTLSFRSYFQASNSDTQSCTFKSWFQSRSYNTVFVYNGSIKSSQRY